MSDATDPAKNTAAGAADDGDKFLDKVKDTASDLKDKAEDLYEKAKDKAGDLYEKAKDKFDKDDEPTIAPAAPETVTGAPVAADPTPDSGPVVP